MNSEFADLSESHPSIHINGFLRGMRVSYINTILAYGILMHIVLHFYDIFKFKNHSIS